MSDLQKKLQVKPGDKGRIINKPRGLKLALRSSNEGRDFALVFVANLAELNTYAAEAISGLKTDGLLWFCYPKKSSGIKTDINRDCGWPALKDQGYRGVRQIAIDNTWSALRFRAHEHVNSK